MNGVSIIIPAYNSEKTIAECINAAQNLDWDGEVEVIVVNLTIATVTGTRGTIKNAATELIKASSPYPLGPNVLPARMLKMNTNSEPKTVPRRI